jgi:hypothetical protein
LPLPIPKLGLVVHYGFIWSGPGRRDPPDAGKDRPCLIVDLKTAEAGAGGREVLRVTYLPISHVAPRAREKATAIPSGVARHLGLTARSFLYTSYGVEDDWPFDLAHVPGSNDRFDYGLVPPKFFQAIIEDYAFYLATHPRFVHRP